MNKSPTSGPFCCSSPSSLFSGKFTHRKHFPHVRFKDNLSCPNIGFASLSLFFTVEKTVLDGMNDEAFLQMHNLIRLLFPAVFTNRQEYVKPDVTHDETCTRG